MFDLGGDLTTGWLSSMNDSSLRRVVLSLLMTTLSV